MPKFESNYSRENYDKTQEDEASLKAQIAGAKSADEMMEIAAKLKEVEKNKNEMTDSAQEEANLENEEMVNKEKEEDEKSAKELKGMKLKDENESAQKINEIREKIDNDEMENKAYQMMTHEQKDLSFERADLLRELEFWAKEDPIELAKSVKTIYENDHPENNFMSEYKYLNQKGEEINKRINFTK